MSTLSTMEFVFAGQVSVIRQQVACFVQNQQTPALPVLLLQRAQYLILSQEQVV